MKKFSQAEYTKDAIASLIKKLHVADEYPYEVLGDYAGLSASMMRQIADGNREIKAKNFQALVYNLAYKDGNLRGLKLSMPGNYTITKNEGVEADGCPDNEVVEGGEALYLFRDGHKSMNTEAMDKGIDQLEEVLERAKQERALRVGDK